MASLRSCPAMPRGAARVGGRARSCGRLAGVARQGPARRLERNRHRRPLARGRTAGQLADADQRRLRGTGGRRRPRVRHRLAAHQGQSGHRARRRARREHRQILWTKEWQTNYSGLQLVYAIGPRATPTVDGDRVYVLGAMGNLLALDVKTGRVLWQKDYVKDFNASVPTWGMAGAPLVDGDRLICLVGGEPDAQADRAQQAHRRGSLALAVVGLRARLQPADHHRGGRRAAAHHLPSRRASARSIRRPARCTGRFEHTRRRWALSSRRRCSSGPYLFVTSQYGGARMLQLDETKPGADAAVERSGRAGSAI